jgi:hypothetical protein
VFTASYNSLDVPLVHSWQCMLMRAGDYEQEARRRRSSSSRDDWNSGRSRSSSLGGSSFERDDEKDERRQLEQDRQDFAQYFRPDWDLRTISGGADLRAVQSFLSDHLNVAHWNLPTDNESIERVLKEAVSSGRLVPVINREWRGVAGRASRPAPAPLRWPAGGGGGSVARSASWFPPGTTSWQGEPVLSGPYDPAGQASQLAAARSAFSASSDDAVGSQQGDDDGGGDLLGMVEAGAGAALGSDDNSDDATTDDSDTSDAQASTDSGGTSSSTPLGDASVAVTRVGRICCAR